MSLRGTVNRRREATVPLRVRGPTGTVSALTALLDTGCTASLVLPELVATRLGLQRTASRAIKLGDGTMRQVDAYDAELDWDGRWVDVLVYTTGREPLVGMRLLAGHRLQVDVVPGGAVEVTALP